jgi:BASS family bile acid:Na+ symporter
LPAGERLVVGYAAGHRNAGLMVAAMGGVLPDQTWLYFASVQAPIYLTPLLIGALARAITTK